MLESTTEITNANKKIKKIKKIERTINFVKLKLDIHSNTFLVKVVLDIALKIYSFFSSKGDPFARRSQKDHNQTGDVSDRYKGK